MTYQYEQGLMTLAEVQMLFEGRLIYNWKNQTRRKKSGSVQSNNLYYNVHKS
jgi:hypothetical protein